MKWSSASCLPADGTSRREIAPWIFQPSRSSHAILGVLAPVVHDIRQRVPRLSRTRDDHRMVAVGKHRSASPWSRPALADRHVQMLRRGDLEALHAPREGGLVLRLDQQVNMRALDTEMHDPEVSAPRGDARCLADRLIRLPAPQAADGLDSPQNVTDESHSYNRFRRYLLKEYGTYGISQCGVFCWLRPVGYGASVDKHAMSHWQAGRLESPCLPTDARGTAHDWQGMEGAQCLTYPQAPRLGRVFCFFRRAESSSECAFEQGANPTSATRRPRARCGWGTRSTCQLTRSRP
jgi:hypothetical protein